MKRFVWRLQRVLDIKKKEEQKTRAELLELTEKLAETRSELLVRKKMLESIIEGLAEGDPRRRLGDQEFFLKHSKTSTEQLRKLEDNLLRLESQQKKKISELLRVRKFKEGLEKLRVEAKTQFIKKQEKLEQKDLDERATISFVRKT